MIKELEEAATISAQENSYCTDGEKIVDFTAGFKQGAYWMEERMFSAEDMFEFAGYLAGVRAIQSEKDAAEVFAFWVNKYKSEKVIV